MAKPLTSSKTTGLSPGSFQDMFQRKISPLFDTVRSLVSGLSSLSQLFLDILNEAVSTVLSIMCILFNINCAIASFVSYVPSYLDDAQAYLKYRLLVALDKPLCVADRYLERAVNHFDECSDPVTRIIGGAVDPVAATWMWFRLRIIEEKGLRWMLSHSPDIVKVSLRRVQALINSYRNRKAPILQLPTEILQQIVSFCDVDPATAPTSGTKGIDELLIVEQCRFTPELRRIKAHTPALKRTSRSLRYICSVIAYKGAAISLMFRDIEATLAWFERQHPNALSGIAKLSIDVERERPANYHAFRKICRILKRMPCLKSLTLSLPLTSAEVQFLDPSPGIISGPRWHRDCLKQAIHTDYTTMRGYDWEPSIGASWVCDLLSINGGQFEAFNLRGRGPEGSERLFKSILETAMLSPLPDKMLLMRGLQAHQRGWAEPPSFAGMAKYWRAARESDSTVRLSAAELVNKGAAFGAQELINGSA